MKNYMTVTVEGGIATITLDETGAPVNTVSPDWVDAMTATFEKLAADTSIRGIILTSAKAGFMAGADLKFVLDHGTRMGIEEALIFSQHATRLHRLIETCGKTVVAAINGFALGGGYELALACTYRIASDSPKTVVGLPEVNVGLLPGSGGTQRLPRMIGLKVAAPILLDGKSFGADEALKIGMVDAVVPVETLLDAARAWIDTNPDCTRPWDRKGFRMPESDGLLKQDTAAFFSMSAAKLLARYGERYPAPIAILACLFEGLQVPLDKGLLVESRYFAKLLTDPVARNIVRTMFVNKGLATRGARRPQGTPRKTVTKLGVLGAGMMGAGIAHVAAQAGIDVVLLDTTNAAAEKGKAHSAKLFAKSVERNLVSRTGADAALARIKPTTEYGDLAGADLIVEAVFEDTAIKADVTAKADAATGGQVLFASNTSSLPITQLAHAFSRPEAFIGLHFFSPVDRMALVEVITGEQTSEETLAHALDFVAQLRKTPILANDSRGFYTSRVFQTFIFEGMALLRDGVKPSLIENAAKLAGMPVGPLAVIDEVSIPLPLKVVHQNQSEDPAYRSPPGMEVMEAMIELGRLGRSAGGGFYDYPEGGRKRLWNGLSEAFPIADVQPDVAEVQQRLLYIQSLETVRCLDENVLTHATDGDLGSVLGWSFPTWTGGTLSLIETVGLTEFVGECDRLAGLYGSRFSPPARLREMATAGTTFQLS